MWDQIINFKYFPYSYAEFGKGTQEYEALTALSPEEFDEYLFNMSQTNSNMDIEYDETSDLYIVHSSAGRGDYFGTPISTKDEENSNFEDVEVEEANKYFDKPVDMYENEEREFDHEKDNIRFGKDYLPEPPEEVILDEVTTGDFDGQIQEYIKNYSQEELREILINDFDVDPEWLTNNYPDIESLAGLIVDMENGINESKEENEDERELLLGDEDNTERIIEALCDTENIKKEQKMSNKNIVKEGDDDKRISSAFQTLVAAKKAVEEANTQLVINLGYHFQKLYGTDLTDINNTLESARKQIETLSLKIRNQLKR